MGALRIVHEKFRAKKVADEYEQFKSSFNNAIAAAPDMKPHISKAHEDMNPLKVLNLFKAISDDVGVKPVLLEDDIAQYCAIIDALH